MSTFVGMLIELEAESMNLERKVYTQFERSKQSPNQWAEYAEIARQSTNAQLSLLRLGGMSTIRRLSRLRDYISTYYAQPDTVREIMLILNDPNGAPYDYIVEMGRDILEVYVFLELQRDTEQIGTALHFYDLLIKASKEVSLTRLLEYERVMLLHQYDDAPWIDVHNAFLLAWVGSTEAPLQRYSRGADIAIMHLFYSLKNRKFSYAKQAYHSFQLAVKHDPSVRPKLTRALGRRIYNRISRLRYEIGQPTVIYWADEFRTLCQDFIRLVTGRG